MDEEDRGEPNITAEVLKFYHIVGHFSFHKLKILAEKGISPKRLAKCSIPVLSS